MQSSYCRGSRLAVAFAFTVMVCSATGLANADPGVTAHPGMEIRQGNTVCMIGLVEPRLRVALTSGQCGGGKSLVTDRDGKPVGSVVLGRRATAEDAAAESVMPPVEYEVIALAPEVAASDLLPNGLHLQSTPGLRAEPGLPVCQYRSSGGQKCGSVGSVSNGRFSMEGIAVDSRDFGGPVYALTGDNDAVIVGLFEGMLRSAPQMESWQAVMQQVTIDGSAQGHQQVAGVHVISSYRPLTGALAAA